MIRITTEERAALVPLAAPGCIEIPTEFHGPEGERRAFGRSPSAPRTSPLATPNRQTARDGRPARGHRIDKARRGVPLGTSTTSTRPAMTEGYKGRLELTWTNKDMRLLAYEDGSYVWVPPADYRVAEVRLLDDAGIVGQVGDEPAASG